MSTIPITKLKEGCESAIENAESLLKAAQILYNHGFYASSTQLALLSCEEAGKAYGIALHLSKNEEISKKQWEKGVFRKHWFKLYWAEEAAKLSLDKRVIEAIQKKEAEASLARILRSRPHKGTIKFKAETIKQRATYLDYDFDKEIWLKPNTSLYTTAPSANGFLGQTKGFIKAVEQNTREIIS
jgi:AbiV family abortive infection protein